MNIEDDQLDLLQNIEFIIIGQYRQDANLLDMDARDAVDALARHYQAEESGRLPPKHRLADRSSEIFDMAQALCEFRLGRATPPPQSGAVNTLAEIIAALKRIRSSIDFWNKRGGRQGYLSFVAPYIR